ncbi:beta-glucuronidase [Streptococcus sp. S784/96/1]|uniref:beta-glucuronidase n=1 Tax=Streptococcus sp. S784/96/1 TaxID=2653499 RepID=UPI00138A2BC8|nr:beta-glucuronidase [Streptococcus sp. S784/96/1]
MLYPQLTKTRSLYDLNGVWNFKLGDHNPHEKLSSETVMVVPTSFNDVSVDKDVRNYIGDFWYERGVDIPKVGTDEELVLRFGSVTHRAKVYVNGEFLGEHEGGFTPFEIIVPENYYQEQTLKISVCANNELNYTTLPVGNYFEEVQEDGSIKKVVKENFDFFNYAGIHRPVKLVVRPKTHISDIVIVPSLSEDLQSAEVSVTVATSAAVDEVRVTILDEERNVVVTAENGRAVIENVHLWEVLDAYLYTAQVELYKGGELVDTYSEPFGVRSVRVADGQFFVNEKPVYFKGFGKHEDTFINGRGLNEAANLMDLNLLKEMGANSFRTSHYPYSEEMMRLADRMGVLVIDEVPAVGLFQGFAVTLGVDTGGRSTFENMKTKEAHEQVIDELLARDKNHACVVMWVVANEPASHEEGAREYFEPLINQFREKDLQNRPVTIVNIGTAGLNDLTTDLIDVICINRYYGWYENHSDLTRAEIGLRKELLEWQHKFPNKPLMVTEYGADTFAGFHSMWDIPYTETYQCDYYAMNHKVFDEIENFVGEHVWNFADFETNVAIIRIKGNHKGLFTRNREPKAVVREIQKRWRSIPHYYNKKRK